MKKKLTTEIINNIFNIKESFELPKVLLQKLLNKNEKNKLCNELLQYDFDMSNDCLRDYFQENNANRNNLKQDYTPDCICKLISMLIPETDNVIDICSGTGALSIGIGKDIYYQCEELSQMSIPVLLLNLCVRGFNATVLEKDVLENNIFKVYQLRKNGKFSDIEIVDNYKEEKTNVVISNPPYSLPWQPKNDNRFNDYELAPKSKSDYAFVLDGLSRLTETGQAFYILPSGVLFRGQKEGKIRQQLIKNNLIDTVISLPENLFLNTCIPVIVLVLKKAKVTSDILFIDASKLFDKGKKQNNMTDEHIKKIVEVYSKRESVNKFSSVIPLNQIEENDFNLNISRYVDTYEPEPLPPIEDLVKDIVNCRLELLHAENEIANMIAELHGTTPEEERLYRNAMLPFLNYINENSVIDIASREWVAYQTLIKMAEELSKTPTKKIWFLDVVDIERAKKDVIYKKGNLILQFSATDRKINYLDKDQTVATKYGVIKPKNINGKYLFYILEKELPGFLERYQTGININPEIFKYLKIQIHTSPDAQEYVIQIMKCIEKMLESEEKEVDEWQDFKKFHIRKMFV